MQVTFPLALFLVFLTLKLTHIIAWSWLWVTAPIWLSFVFALAVMLFGLGAALYQVYKS